MSEDQLLQNNFFYRNLIEDSPDGILLTSEKGMIRFASASVKKILEYEPGELLNKNAFEFFHPDERDLGISFFADELNNSAKSKWISARLKKRSGEWVWCTVRGKSMLSDTDVNGVLICFFDDSLRKKAEASLAESEQLFRHLIHNLSLGIILVNEKGEIIIGNRATANMFELTEKQLIGINVLHSTRNIIHENGEEFTPADFPIATAIQTKKPARNIVMGMKRMSTDERIWLLVDAEPVLDAKGNIIHVISSFADITEQKNLSSQLMEQEIQKQKQLMQATIDGQEKERHEIGRELHDNISQHLTTTRLYLEVAKEKAGGEMLKMINQAHKGLLDIVSEIRQLSQTLVPPSLIDIGLIESIQDLCDSLKNTPAFTIELQCHPFDESLLSEKMKLMLYRIFQEQINNIIRHSGADVIHAKLQTAEGHVMLSVADNGKGFDMKTVKKGLGFDNMINRANLFGGKVKIDSEPGKGCIVQVTIPMA